MANLLVHLESFAWHDLTIDRAIDMDDLILAVDQAETWEDKIYGHPDAYNPQLGWGTIDDLLYCTEEECRLFTEGWFRNDHQKILIKLWRNATPGQAKGLQEMEQENAFKGQNNGLIGCRYDSRPPKMVYNEASLSNLHAAYTASNPALRKISPAYFYLHYQPVLSISAAGVNDKIDKKQVDSCFKRLDVPTLGPDGQVLHKEQVGMHFNDKANSCLYIDGTWKHGGFIIPKSAKIALEAWGFLLPPDQR